MAPERSQRSSASAQILVLRVPRSATAHQLLSTPANSLRTGWHLFGVVDKLREIPRRARTNEEGFDALGIVAVSCRNDGTPVELWLDPPAPQPGDIFEYDAMIRRVADAYEARHK